MPGLSNRKPSPPEVGDPGHRDRRGRRGRRRTDRHGGRRRPDILTRATASGCIDVASDDTGLYRPDRSFFAASSLEVAPLLLGAVLTARDAGGGGRAAHHGGRGVRRRRRRPRLARVPRADQAQQRDVRAAGTPVHLFHLRHARVRERRVLAGGRGDGGAAARRPRSSRVRSWRVAAVARVGVRRRRNGPVRVVSDRDLGRGPARLVVAPGIRLDENGSDLYAPPFSLFLPQVGIAVTSGPRTGVSGAGGGRRVPLALLDRRAIRRSRPTSATPSRTPEPPVAQATGRGRNTPAHTQAQMRLVSVPMMNRSRASVLRVR